MNSQLRADAERIVREAIAAVQPETAVRRALEGIELKGRTVLTAVGKAAWRMAKAALDTAGERISGGVVITKYGHVFGRLPGIECFEAGHPVPDANSVAAAEAAIGLVRGLGPGDTVLFLVSGGGSALFEKPLIPLSELSEITSELLASGADISEINTVRKRLSGVKAGRFAELCFPARVETVALSDVLGDRLDLIASGPACPDPSTEREALEITAKYGLRLSEAALGALRRETPKELSNVHSQIAGSVRELCAAAARTCSSLGYEPIILTDSLSCEARDAGRLLASMLRSHSGEGRSLAFIAGGETVVKVTGSGVGGRNQEIALAAAEGISGMDNAAVFSVGSDGTDGPTDAAGGYADGDTACELRSLGISIPRVLENNDSYNALKKTGGLIMTGPTGTNVNDLSAALIRR